MKTFQLLLLSGSSFVLGSVLGVNVGLKEQLQDTSSAGKHHLTWNQETSTFTTSQERVSDQQKDPLTVLVFSIYNSAKKAWNSVTAAISTHIGNDSAAATGSSTTPFSSLLFSSSSSNGDASSDQLVQQRNRIVLLFALSLGGSYLLLKMAHELATTTRHQNHQHPEAGDDNHRVDVGSIFGRTPPPDYRPVSISLDDVNASMNTQLNNHLPACIVCQSHPRDCMIQPCCHVALCFQCSERMVEHHNMVQPGRPLECPVCRTTVRRFDFMLVS